MPKVRLQISVASTLAYLGQVLTTSQTLFGLLLGQKRLDVSLL